MAQTKLLETGDGAIHARVEVLQTAGAGDGSMQMTCVKGGSIQVD